MTLPNLATVTPSYGVPHHCCTCQVGWHSLRPTPCWSCGGPAVPGDIRHADLWRVRL